MTQKFDLSLYLVLDSDLCGSQDAMVQTARLAVAGGATMVQLRDKNATTESRIALGNALKTALTNSHAKLIVNDDIEAALAIGADGLHIGQSDMDPLEARQRLGSKAILGLSAETIELVQRISPEIIDYAGLGPVFATPTKPDHKKPIGFTGLAQLVGHCPVPSVAIGGLKAAHVPEAFATGVKGIAVVSAICGQNDPLAATWALHQAIKREAA
jgi:thiamine-phosphate pyrophosphorylase